MKRVRSLLAGLLFAAALALTACARPAPQPAASDLQIAIQPAPEGARGQYLTVSLADAAGAPITDAEIALEGNMNHAGMVPVQSETVADDADGAADGSYRVPFAFTMLGDWIITVQVTRPDAGSLSHNIELTVTGDGVQAK